MSSVARLVLLVLSASFAALAVSCSDVQKNAEAAAPARPASVVAPVSEESEKLFRRAMDGYSGATPDVDAAAAFGLFVRAAETGHPLAEGYAGLLTHEGEGTARDAKAGIEKIRRSL